MKEKILILGITGQDGSYLAEHLLEKGYDVHGLYRRTSTGNLKNIEGILDKITLHQGDLADPVSLYRVINNLKPHKVFNEADQDHVGWSYNTSGYSCDVTGKAVADLLEILKQCHPSCKFFQPLSSHMFGKTSVTPQNEDTGYNPQSPYAAAKVFAKCISHYYRDAHGLFVSTGILYNHTSIRKDEDYVLNKIVNGAIRISKGLQDKLTLGPIDIEVDYGYAPEYVTYFDKILNLEKADDFIISTGETISLREVCKTSFDHFNMNYEDHITYDKKFERPGKMGLLRGDISKAQEILDYLPKIKGKALVLKLIEEELKKY
tara:strand:- start:75421 stop:76377 length:957 start_codon:yes stop_codon:yes gene_type:complete